MKPPEKVIGALPPRGVSFAEGTQFLERAPRPMIPLHESTKLRLNHHRAKQMICQNLFDGKIAVLDEYFKPYSQQELTDFYKEKGAPLFRAALLTPTTSEPFTYLIRNVPNHIACEILTNNNFSSLAGFIGVKRLQEEEGRFTSEYQNVFVEKLQLMVSLGNEAINNYIRENQDYKHLVNRGLRPTPGL